VCGLLGSHLSENIYVHICVEISNSINRETPSRFLFSPGSLMSFFCSESNRKELKAMAKLGRNFQSDSICSNQNGNEKRRWKWRWRWPRRREHGSHGAPCLTSSSVSAAWAIIISKLQIHKTYAKLCAMSAPWFEPPYPVPHNAPARGLRHHPHSETPLPSCIFVSLHLSAAICRCFCCWKSCAAPKALFILYVFTFICIDIDVAYIYRVYMPPCRIKDYMLRKSGHILTSVLAQWE